MASELMRRSQGPEGSGVTVDLERRVVRDASGFEASFMIDEFRRHCLLEGLDDIGLTLRYESQIAAYEHRRAMAAGFPREVRNGFS
jgi:3-isopropylmalate/(R)-2-methylmalate dehydratase small subunit